MSEGETGIFFCSLCDFITDTKSRYDNHTKLATCFKYQCSICDFKTSLRSNLSSHINSHEDVTSKAPKVLHSNYILNCNECDFLTKKTTNLRRHKSAGCFKFRCKICSFKTSRLEKIRNHKKEFHTEEKKFICYSCDYKTKEENNLNSHLLNNDCFRFHCPKCDFKTSLNTSLKGHLKANHGDIKVEYFNPLLTSSKNSKSYECSSCDWKGKKKSNFEYHKTKKCYRFACMLCDDFKTSLQKNLSAHVKNVHQIDSYKSSEQYKLCKRKKDREYRREKTKYYIRHKLKNEAMIELTCNKCDYEATDKILLEKHLCYRFKCEVCDFKTSLTSKITKHYQELHPDDSRYKCDKCKFGSFHIYLLKRHQQKVHSGQIYKCEHCHYKNWDCNELTRHKRLKHDIHSTRKGIRTNYITFSSKDKTKFPCYICSKINEGKVKHVEHLCSHKIVAKDNVFSCSDCDYEAIDEITIRRHVEVHLKLESNHCKECNATFSRLDTYAVHLRTKHDADEKTSLQTCKDCQYSTKRKDAMKRHINMVHKKVRFKCTQCPYNGSDQRQVKLHFEKKHKGLPLKMEGLRTIKQYKFKCQFCQYSVSDRRSLRGHLELKHSSEIKMENNYLKDEILEFKPKVLRIENSELLKEEGLSIKREMIDSKSNLSNLRLRLRLNK